MAPSILSEPSILDEHVQSFSPGFTKPGFEAQVTPVIFSSKDEGYRTPSTMQSLDGDDDPVVIVGMGG